MTITILKNLFRPRLAEHIPGEKRVYKNMFGKTIRTIERVEEKIEKIDRDVVSLNIKTLENSELQPNTKKAVLKMNELASRGEPIKAVGFIVSDKNGLIERANSSLKCGEAVARYKTSFKNGDLDTAKASFKSNF